MYRRLPVKSGLIAAAMLCAGATTGALALPPLEQNDRVNREFLAAAVGDEIRKNCPTISARLFRVLSKANELENYALELGYSRDEIRALRKNDAARARLKADRDAYLADHGVTAGDAESYCQLGRTEIEQNSLTGWLLRAN